MIKKYFKFLADLSIKEFVFFAIFSILGTIALTLLGIFIGKIIGKLDIKIK